MEIKNIYTSDNQDFLEKLGNRLIKHSGTYNLCNAKTFTEQRIERLAKNIFAKAYNSAVSWVGHKILYLSSTYKRNSAEWSKLQALQELSKRTLYSDPSSTTKTPSSSSLSAAPVSPAPSPAPAAAPASSAPADASLTPAPAAPTVPDAAAAPAAAPASPASALDEAAEEDGVDESEADEAEEAEAASASSDVKSPQEPITDLERDFWESNLRETNTSFRQMLQLVLQLKSKKQLPDDGIRLLLEGYIQQRKEQKLELTDNETSLLLKSIDENLFRHTSMKEPSPKTQGTGEIRRARATKGDGSCGIHALLGVETNGIYQADNVGLIRKQFCDYLREKNRSGELPTGIETVLCDYFDNFRVAPPTFQIKAVEIYQKHMEGINGKSIAETDEIKKKFAQEVFEIYLNELENVENYLLQEELIEIANWQGIEIELIQPGWGLERRELTHSYPNQDRGFSTQVSIFYNGYNHYQRVE